MKKILAALALSTLVAGPSFAKGPTEKQKEKGDAAHKGADDKAAKADLGAARAYFTRAAQHDAEARKEWEAAGKHWQERQNALHRMYTHQAQARAERMAGARLNAAAHRLFLAEQDRAAALADRLAADQLNKNAYGHRVAAAAAQTAINEGNKAKADLQKNPQFADAVKAIDADIARNQSIVSKENAAAKADSDVASHLMGEATKKEQQANNLEKPVVAAPPFHPPAPPAAKPIVVKAVPVPKK
jgi:hypothetical protein